jgi:DNA-binding response OmpR family regulator
MNMAKNKILIVDDEEDIVNLVRLILEDAGYEVYTATNGIEALDRIRTKTFDLVLLDIMMPLLSGWEVLKELRENAQTREVPVALLTARASPRDDNRQHPTTYCDYITKPFEPDDLLLRIRHILSG